MYIRTHCIHFKFSLSCLLAYSLPHTHTHAHTHTHTCTHTHTHTHARTHTHTLLASNTLIAIAIHIYFYTDQSTSSANDVKPAKGNFKINHFNKAILHS